MSETQAGIFPRLLIIDDDRHVVDILATKCRLLDFHVETASNGIKAILQATKFKPDILVVDVQMPTTSGFSIASHLVDLFGKSIGVIAISGKFIPSETERWQELGATCVNKGGNFWIEFAAALIDLCPGRANLLQQMRAFNTEIRKKTGTPLIKRFG